MTAASKPPPGFGPIYAASLYPELVAVFRKHWHALAVHGRLRTDLDLVAIPWTETVNPISEVLAENVAT